MSSCVMPLSEPYKRKELPMTNCTQASFNFPGAKDLRLKQIPKEEISHQIVTYCYYAKQGKRGLVWPCWHTHYDYFLTLLSRVCHTQNVQQAVSYTHLRAHE